MSENIILLDNHQLKSKNTSYDSNIRMPADEDDEFLEFYMPTDVYDHDETTNPVLKRSYLPTRKMHSQKRYYMKLLTIE